MKDASFGPGAFSGFTEYRHGELWRGKQRPILKAEKRRMAVDLAVDELRRWNQSPFQFEASVRHGIRRGLVLLGYGWHRADAQAELIVAEALHRIGAKRPSWDEAQRHHVIARENCRWCGDLLAEEDINAGFCCVEHARAARQHWGFESRKLNDTAFATVDRAMRRLAQTAIPCEQCGTKFKPERAGSDQRFCSPVCQVEHRRIDRPERPCRHCQTVFVPKFLDGPRNPNLYCSTACAYKDRPSVRVDRMCACCGSAFTGATTKAKFCSNVCKLTDSKFARGTPPKLLSAVVFDFIAHRQGVRVTDALFAEAA